RKKGQGVNSREVTNLFMLVAAAIVVAVILPGVMGDVTTSMRPFIAEPHLMKLGDADAPAGLASVATSLLYALAGPLGIFVVAALAAGLVQRGFNVSTESMKPELKKISLIKGLKRMFSLRSSMEFAKGIAKLVIVGAVGVATIMPELDSLELLTSMSTLQYMAQIHDLVIRLLVGVCSILALIAGLDYLYQRYEFLKQMKMSRQEIKDEYKQTEGDPAIKGKIRQLRQERARGRMMAAVPEADVVVTNPTHFAVALKYDADNMNAPTLVAKGADLVAKRIREVAEESDVPIVRNPPLTRALYAAVDLDQEVPVEHYKAVAEVIGYVWRLKGKMRQDGSRAW
ncbi:MAG: flagellar biosynthesis protein FlhB, partial [Alphaproteobacteria bacterium]|nr:flagellar biosynthesis protein FlhB [Alphaproteobacteria bacterium]